MAQREQDDLPYMSVVPKGKLPIVTTSNEQDYSTLKIVRAQFESSLEELYANFNAFDVLIHANPDEAAKNLLRQVEAKQIAYDILSPLLDAMVTAIDGLENKYKGTQ